MYYEGGIRVPMIALWPGVIESGSVCEEPVMQIDLFPTYLELAKAKIEKELDGENLLPLLKQTGRLKRESIYWHMPGYLDRAKPGTRDKNFRTRPVSVIRKGGWKLHLYHESGYLMAEEKKLRLTERSSFIIWTMTSQSKTMFHLKKRLLETSYWMNFSLGKRE